MEHLLTAFKGYDQPLDLGRYATLPLAQARGARVRCLRGTLWITQEGDREDYFVRAGESFTIERDGVTLVSAPHGRGTVLVMPPAPKRESAIGRWLALSGEYLLQTRRQL